MPTEYEVARVVARFRARSAYWTSAGFYGVSLYGKLATDPELPENLHPHVIAALEGVKPEAIAQRRKRGSGSSFLRTAQNAIRYPLSAYCTFLAARYVERAPHPAHAEYTQIPS
jgi:hypothetical protein